MLNWNDSVSEQHREELIRQAEREHLIREMLEERRLHPIRRYNPALAWVGRRMMTFGSKLVTMSGEDGQYRPDTNPN